VYTSKETFAWKETFEIWTCTRVERPKLLPHLLIKVSLLVYRSKFLFVHMNLSFESSCILEKLMFVFSQGRRSRCSHIYRSLFTYVGLFRDEFILQELIHACMLYAHRSLHTCQTFYLYSADMDACVHIRRHICLFPHLFIGLFPHLFIRPFPHLFIRLFPHLFMVSFHGYP